jgi:hypothetical protein
MNRAAVANNEKTTLTYPVNQYPDYSLFSHYPQQPHIYPFYPIPKHDDTWKVNNNTIPQKPKQLVNIEDKITSIEDILFIIDKYKFDTEIEYNIDLLSMYMIQTELKELNKMIGMKSLKESVLNQLLYFMQDLHLGKEGDYKHTVIQWSTRYR